MTIPDALRGVRRFLGRRVWLKKSYQSFLALRYALHLIKLRRRNPEGFYSRCLGVDVFCDLRAQTSLWYTSTPPPGNLVRDQIVLESMTELIKGNVLIDVGAHFGFYTAVLCQSLAPNIANPKVIALEPDPDNFGCLRRTTAHLTNPRPVLLNAAVGAEDGEKTLYNHRRSPCLLSYSRAGSTEAQVVDCISLDTLVKDHLSDTDRVAFLKIDVDGAEPDVLRGASNLIRKHQPLIMMEFSAEDLECAGESPRLFLEMLTSDFRVIHLLPDNRQLRVLDLGSVDAANGLFNGRVNDILLVPGIYSMVTVERTIQSHLDAQAPADRAKRHFTQPRTT
jgi:FkbM family methyltransferase